jgi:2-polyprenyl-3-methyl-5-hydroxy-6-metoxy-1,4-benzoquinol methylase
MLCIQQYNMEAVGEDMVNSAVRENRTTPAADRLGRRLIFLIITADEDSMSLIRDAAGVQAAELINITRFENQNVLEIGCGEGYLTRIYGPMTRHVDAIDVDASCIAAAQENIPADLKDKVDFITADISDYAVGLPRTSYDIAVFAWSL